MRRISLNRPKEKIRGIKRRLRALDQWADSFEGYFPLEYATEKYWNWKIPVFDRLVNPPTTTVAIQRHCAQALLRVVAHIAEAKPADCSDAIATALITYPGMFSSEICIFFDAEYFESFYKRDNQWQSLSPINQPNLSKLLGLTVPDNIQESGYLFTSKDEWDGEITTYEEQWWCYCETRHR